MCLRTTGLRIARICISASSSKDASISGDRLVATTPQRGYTRIVLVWAILCAVLLLVLSWRPLFAWWSDDLGNLSLFKGHPQEALALFDRGLRYEPRWGTLHEDRGRALLERDPAAALLEFGRAGCGQPCIAEEGDALVRLGNTDAAIDRYIAAKAVGRIAEQASEIAAHGKYEEAIALERALIARLHDSFLERAQLASAYATLGNIEIKAAQAQRSYADRYHRESIHAFATASDLAPFNEGYLLSLAFSQAQWGNPDSARRAFGLVLALHPHQADAEAALAKLGKASPGPTHTR